MRSIRSLSGRRVEPILTELDYKVSREANITCSQLTFLHIEILGHRIFSPPENAMMHFIDKIGKLFSSDEFSGKILRRIIISNNILINILVVDIFISRYIYFLSGVKQR